MEMYQYKIIQNHPRETLYKFEREYPESYHVGESIWFPETFKLKYTYVITSIHHYPVDKFIVLNVNKE